MHRHPYSRFLLPLLLATALLLGACADPAPEDRAQLSEAPPEAEAPPVTVDEADAPTSTTPAPAEEPAVVIARATTPLTVRAQPTADAAVVADLAPTTSFGSPRTLLVLDEQDGWAQVQVPVRPNGTTGWIPVDDVQLLAGRHRVEVDLASRHLTVYEDDAVVLETPVAIGSPDAPTPTGTFAIVDSLQSPNPDGDYGPRALGVGGYSTTFSEFAGGDGQIGIHGTNDPSSIGQAVSHGCVRVPNDVITRLADILPLGTPVTIA
jgi:lipoprotein-anchoring transpeptidase ErfK/SrfK